MRLKYLSQIIVGGVSVGFFLFFFWWKKMFIPDKIGLSKNGSDVALITVYLPNKMIPTFVNRFDLEK